MPLSLCNLTKLELDPLVSKFGNKAGTWKGRLMAKSGRLVLLKAVDLAKFGRALRIRWHWMAWKHPERPWVSAPLPCSNEEKELFAMATEITVGDGRATNFWQDRSLEGSCTKMIAPSLFKIAVRKNRLVWDALKDEKWLQDLSRGLLDDMLYELSELARRLDRVVLHEGQPDAIT
ncbi:hypothetical protein D1007_58392 [Hordeum vulgare]|nr:hypothetical protein D1007_58392 [Hordeum vulgare]